MKYLIIFLLLFGCKKYTDPTYNKIEVTYTVTTNNLRPNTYFQFTNEMGVNMCEVKTNKLTRIEFVSKQNFSLISEVISYNADYDDTIVLSASYRIKDSLITVSDTDYCNPKIK